MQNRNVLLELQVVAAYPLLIFALFYIASLNPDSVPFSSDAFIQPYFGEKALVSTTLLFVAALEIPLYYFMFYSKYAGDPSKRLLLITFPSVFAVFGFVIGFLNLNPWAALPYAALGFSIYAIAYIKTLTPGA
ncbi:MAG: hypothetical protein V1827_03850 [Candidatus Micrarchaeota archaeon]